MPSKNAYRDALVKCPYFRAIEVNPCGIRCAGLGVQSSLVQYFADKRSRDEYKKAFCRTFCYEGCLLYCAILEAQEDSQRQVD